MNGDYIIPGFSGTGQDSIEGYAYHKYYAENNSELSTYQEPRFRIVNESANLHFHNGYLLVKGVLQTSTGGAVTAATNCAFINNGPSFLFRSISWRINGTEVEGLNYVGQVSTMAKFIKSDENQQYTNGLMECWVPDTNRTTNNTNTGREARRKWVCESPDTKGQFTFKIKLQDLFGLAGNTSFMYGARHEFAFYRQEDWHALNRAVTTPDVDFKIKLTEMTLNIPVVVCKGPGLLRLKEDQASGAIQNINYMRRYAIMQTIPTGVKDHTWTVQTLPFNKRAKYAILGFQKAFSADQKSNFSLFDHADVSFLSASINQVQIPQIEFKSDFPNDDFCEFYQMYQDLKANYYQIDEHLQQVGISPSAFKTLTTLYCLDVSKRENEYMSSTADIKIDIKFNVETVANINCFALLFNEQNLNINSAEKTVAIR